jgi:hypothetical protein
MATIASDLLQRHIDTLVDYAAQWQTLIADDILWELAYAPSVGHPARLSGRKEVMRHVTWFRGAVDRFRFFNVTIHSFDDPAGAVAEVEAEGVIKSTGAHLSTELRSLPACRRRQDRISSRVFRPGARSQSDEPSNCRSHILKNSNDSQRA